MRCWYGSEWSGRFVGNLGECVFTLWNIKSCFERKCCPQCVHWSSGSGATLCAVSVWQFNPWFDGNLSSHWSHLKDSTSASIAENGREVWERTGDCWIGLGMFTLGEDSTFLFRNFSLLSAFRLRVEGLDFFFFFGKDVASLESRQKAKAEPTVGQWHITIVGANSTEHQAK